MTAAALLLLGAPALQSQGFDLPPGFAITRASDLAESFLSLAFASSGRVYLGVEDGPILWAKDADDDGRFETDGTLTSDIRGCQGLLWFQDQLFATGVQGTQHGLFRLRVSADGTSVEGIDPLLRLTAGGEHGVHGVVAGPDGFLYLAVGDHASIETPPASSDALEDGYEGNLLPAYSDPNGHGLHCEYPHGIVARVDPAGGRWTLHSVGYRNFCDLAFNAEGDLFTVDSDMEWDLGLPWYRPVRVLHCVPGGDYGSRRGSSVWPSWYPDGLPAVVEVGRGSPTGVLVCAEAKFPRDLQGVLLAADWSQGRVLAVRLEPSGSTYSGTIETLLSARESLPITDLAFGPDGALYLTTGGRGVVGDILRLAYTGDAAGSVAPDSRPQRRRPCTGDGDDLYACLGDGDRWVRYAARRVLEQEQPEGLARRVLVEEDPVRLVEGAFLIARARVPGVSADALLRRLEGLLGDREREAEALRAIEVVLLRLGEPSAEARARLAARVLERFTGSGTPPPDPRALRELALLLARLAPERAIDPLLAAIGAEADREQAIHYAFCLSSIQGGFTTSTAGDALRWFERARSWAGGASFAGYLSAMRESLASHLEAEVIAGVAAAEPTGLRTLAFLLARRGAAAPPALAAALRDRFAALGEDAEADAARLDVVRALARSELEGAAAILRQACLGSPHVRDAALGALADAASPEDTERFVAGLQNPSPDLAARCARALLGIGWRPETPADFSRALDAAYRLGSGRARPLLEILCRSAELPPLGGEPDGIRERTEEFTRTLEALESWFRAAHPEVRREAQGAGLGPRWEEDRILGFLTRSAGRAGSPARGREVYLRATCARCHRLGEDAPAPAADPLAFSGPDLTTAARRFDDTALLEAILFPSRAISDQYRNTVVVLDADQSLEGRIVVEDPASLTLRLANGSQERIERSRISSTRPSAISPMPEGLLAASTLEEVKDLFAYLRAGGRVDPLDAAAPDWVPILVGPHRRGWNFDPAVWRAPGGVLVGKGEQLPHSSYLLSKASYSDFEIEFDVRLPTGNSGFQYRSKIDASTPDPIGYQADIGQGYWGSLYISDGRGIAAQADPKLWVPVLDRQGWNHFHVRVVGNRHVIEVNGLVTTDFRDEVFPSGVLGFQVHGGGTMEVRYANVRMRDLR